MLPTRGAESLARLSRNQIRSDRAAENWTSDLFPDRPGFFDLGFARPLRARPEPAWSPVTVPSDDHHA
jgi:hypothetical protein